jgi:outer membrane protein assembly factor BamE (lipoprotein component of BamABCDE complex)
MYRSVRPAGVLLFAVCFLAFAGCGGGKEFTPEEFKQVTLGMDEAQVRKMLGKPLDTFELVGEQSVWWRVKDQYYRVDFEAGKANTVIGPVDREKYEGFKEGLDFGARFQ